MVGQNLKIISAGDFIWPWRQAVKAFISTRYVTESLLLIDNFSFIGIHLEHPFIFTWNMPM